MGPGSLCPTRTSISAAIDEVRARVRALHEDVFYRPIIAATASLQRRRGCPCTPRARVTDSRRIGYRDPGGSALTHIRGPHAGNEQARGDPAPPASRVHLVAGRRRRPRHGPVELPHPVRGHWRLPLVPGAPARLGGRRPQAHDDAARTHAGSPTPSPSVPRPWLGSTTMPSWLRASRIGSAARSHCPDRPPR